MQSDLLQTLGEEQRASIINDLVHGVSVRAIARTIQEEWGEAQGLSRAALEKELTNLRMSIDRGGSSSDLDQASLSISTDALQLKPHLEFESLAALQKRRIEELFKKEREQGKPLPALTTAIKAYENTLFRLQTMRFDLGVDIYKRVKLTPHEWRTARESDDYLTQKQITEAVAELEEILAKRKIPPVRTNL